VPQNFFVLWHIRKTGKQGQYYGGERSRVEGHGFARKVIKGAHFIVIISAVSFAAKTP
jgi:hypothetical protein